VIEYEAARQVNLLKIAEELRRRGVQKVELSTADVTAAFANSKSKIVRRVLDAGGRGNRREGPRLPEAPRL
jgi:glutamyl-tRNA(Gln) amidotransferase subunit E